MNVQPALHRTIVCVDVEGFGAKDRTDRDRAAVREALYRVLESALAGSGVPWNDCYREDRGDGVLLLVSPDVPKSRLVVEFPQQLAAALAEHNHSCGPRARIRVRVSIDAGEVSQDEHGVVGWSLNRAFRLLEAEQVKSALRASSGVVALIASEWFYQQVIRHEPEDISGRYQRVQVSVKETRAHAWLCLPDHHGAVWPPASQPLASATPRLLPAAVGDFVGRTAELTVLARLLQQVLAPGAGVMVAAITGTAGVGKTALAVHWARQVRSRFPDGHLYINLCGHDSSPELSPDQALDRMLRALDVPVEKIPSGLEAKAGLYRSALDGRRMLVVLDNAATAEQVRPLLPGTGGCMVLITSRDRLPGLIALDGAHPITLERLDKADALDLLRRIIGAENVNAEPKAAAELARRCAYLPLALRVAAVRAATHPHSTLADVADELGSEQHPLDVLNTNDEYTTMRTVFFWSYRALGLAEARMFRLLGLHRGPDFSVEAAAALAGTTPYRARRLLDLLIGKNLVEETARHRFRLHDLLRCYAAECARNQEWHEERAAAVRRMLVWYLHTADNARSHLAGRDYAVTLTVPDTGILPHEFVSPVEAQQWCESERLNLIAAVRYAADAGHHDICWRLTVALAIYFFMRKDWDDWTATHQIGLTSARHLNDRLAEAYVLNHLGFASQDHRFEESIEYRRQALSIFREFGDRTGEGFAFLGIGHASRRLRRFEESIEYFHKALIILQEIGSQLGKSLALFGLGYAYAGQHNYREAIDYFLRTLVLVNDQRTQGWSLHGLGFAYRRLRMFAESIDCFHKALAIFQEIGDWRGQAEALYNMSKAQRDCGYHELARQSREQAFEIFQELNIPREG